MVEIYARKSRDLRISLQKALQLRENSVIMKAYINYETERDI